MSFTDTDRSLFNVVVVSNVPCAGEPYRHSQVANVQPLEWARAVKWLNGIIEGIGRHWLDDKFTDCYLEPVDCPRPWSPETLGAFIREESRGEITEPLPRGEYLHSILCEEAGVKAVDAFSRVCGYKEQPGREGVHVEYYQQAADRLMGRAS